MNNLFIQPFFALLFFFFISCSNSESVNSVEESVGVDNTVAINNSQDSYSPKYISLDDSEYPYVGLPRIVIETENFKKIQNREEDISAKLQVWGAFAPESEVMNLTIRGRGNSTWGYPKKPYAIKFEKKVPFLGMLPAKKWVLLANYRDRTLMRNAVAFELARKSSLAWTPSGRFVELYLNHRFLGCYYVCEKIEVKSNRLKLDDSAFLLEFDAHFDADFKFRTTYNGLPVNVKHPQKPDSLSFNYIQDYIDSVEKVLMKNVDDTEYANLIDQESFADYLLVYAMANNGEPKIPKSVFMYKDVQGKLTAGPVWDFDYATFNTNVSFFVNRNTPIFQRMLQKDAFKSILANRWRLDKSRFEHIFDFIDSLATYTEIANNRNIKTWPIKIDRDFVGDEEKTFEESIDMLKECIRKRIEFIETEIETQGAY